MSDVREKWELPLQTHVRQIRCVHIVWSWQPGVCQLQADGLRWIWKISAFSGEEFFKRSTFWMIRVVRQAKCRCTMEWESDIPEQWVERIPTECANEFVAKWLSTFCIAGWLPGTSRAPSGVDVQEWFLKNVAVGKELVNLTRQTLWSDEFQRAYWRSMTCQKEHAARIGFFSVSIGIIQYLFAILLLCFCSWVAYNSIWVQSLPGFYWAMNHGNAALERRQNQQEQWRLSILGLVAESERRCIEGMLPSHCRLMEYPFDLLRKQLCESKAPILDSLQQAIRMLRIYAQWSSSTWHVQMPDTANPLILGGRDWSTSGCLPHDVSAQPSFTSDSSVASWPDWTPQILSLLPDDQSKLLWIRGSYEARLTHFRKCWELSDSVLDDLHNTKCERQRRRLWSVAPSNWLQRMNLPGPLVQSWGHWEADSITLDSLIGEERKLYTLLVDHPRCEILQKEKETRLVAWRERYMQVRGQWMAGPAKSFPFLVATDEEIDAGSWIYWFGSESPFNQLQRAYDTLSTLGLRILAWEQLSLRMDSLRGSLPFAPLAEFQWHYRFCGGAHLPVSMAVGSDQVELSGEMECKDGEISFASAWNQPLVWGKPPLNIRVKSSPWQILRFVAMGRPMPGGGIRRQLRIDGGGFHEMATLELHVKKGNPHWLDLDNWQLNWPGLDALPISYQNDRSTCHGQESQFSKRNSSGASEYSLERGGRLGATEARATTQITGIGTLHSR